MDDDEETAKSVDALFDARAEIHPDLRAALTALDGVNEQAAAMFQIAIGRLLDLGADRDLICRGTKAVFAVDDVFRAKKRRPPRRRV